MGNAGGAPCERLRLTSLASGERRAESANAGRGGRRRTTTPRTSQDVRSSCRSSRPVAARTKRTGRTRQAASSAATHTQRLCGAAACLHSTNGLTLMKRLTLTRSLRIMSSIVYVPRPRRVPTSAGDIAIAAHYTTWFSLLTSTSVLEVAKTCPRNRRVDCTSPDSRAHGGHETGALERRIVAVVFSVLAPRYFRFSISWALSCARFKELQVLSPLSCNRG